MESENYEQKKDFEKLEQKSRKELIKMCFDGFTQMFDNISKNNIEYDKQRKGREILDKILRFLLYSGLIFAFIFISVQFINLFKLPENTEYSLKDYIDPMKDLIVYIIIAFAGISFSLKPFFKKTGKIAKAIEVIIGDD